MNYEDVQKVSNAAKAKSNLVNTNFFKYFIRAVMAEIGRASCRERV